MDEQTRKLRAILDQKLEQLWQQVGWNTPRETADRIRREALQASHALHRAANPAYRERCEREGIGEQLDLAQLPALVFPEEIYKGYAEQKRANGQKLGLFCEQDVPLLLKYLNHYLVEPIQMDGLKQSYMFLTSIRGGLDRLRDDIQRSQGTFMLTSSGTTGTLSLIPVDKDAFHTLERVTLYTYDAITDVPGYGPIDPAKHCLVAFAIRRGSLMQAVTFNVYAEGFGERAFLAIPAAVYTRELRWRADKFAGLSGKLIRPLIRSMSAKAGKKAAQQTAENFAMGLKQAESLGVRTAIFINPWQTYRTLLALEARLQEQVARGEKKPGEPLVRLASGSVLIFGGGNKSNLAVSEEEITALCRRLIGGLDKVLDAYGQSESLGGAIRCSAGNYHLDPHMELFSVDNYLAYYDPRQVNRVPAIITGDIIGEVHDEPCSCGAPTRYFTRIARDSENRGSKGCIAALAEYQ